MPADLVELLRLGDSPVFHAAADEIERLRRPNAIEVDAMARATGQECRDIGYVDRVERERDEARAEAEMWKRERARLSDSYHRMHDAWNEALAEVERLRAALLRIENATSVSGDDAGLMRTIAHVALYVTDQELAAVREEFDALSRAALTPLPKPKDPT